MNDNSNGGGTKRTNLNVGDLVKQRLKNQQINANPPTTTPIPSKTSPNIPHLVSQPGSKMNTTRKIHYAFTVLYAVAAFTIVASSIIWINFWTTFQSGAISLNVGIAFALFATTIVGKLDRKSLTGEFIVYRKCAVIIGMTAIVAIILSLFPLYNIVNILTKCPSYTTVSIDPNSNTKSMIKAIEIVNDTQPTIGQFVDLVGKYDFMRDGKKIENRFYLTYDIAHQRLTQKQKVGTNRWIQVESSDIEFKTLSSYMAELNRLPSSVKKNMSQYYFIEQEIKRLVGENNYNLVNIHDGIEIDSSVEDQSFKAADSAYSHPNNKDVKASTNPLYLELMAQEICLYEYSFAILWAIFIILLILLNVATVPAYAWIKNATT